MRPIRRHRETVRSGAILGSVGSPNGVGLFALWARAGQASFSLLAVGLDHLLSRLGARIFLVSDVGLFHLLSSIAVR